MTKAVKVVVGVSVTVLVVMWLHSRGERAREAEMAREETRVAGAPPPVPAAPPPPPDAPSVDEAVAEIEKNWPKTLNAAIEMFKPSMDDTMDKTSAGTAMLVAWCAENLRWSDFKRPVVGTRSPAKVKKDVDDARGKIICSPLGRIVQIKKQRQIADARPFYVGLFRGSGEIVHFYAVGSTGELVEGDSAKICGVVTGIFDYHNSAGGIGHAIELVGMFDLPEDRKAK